MKHKHTMLMYPSIGPPVCVCVCLFDLFRFVPLCFCSFSVAVFVVFGCLLGYLLNVSLFGGPCVCVPRFVYLSVCLVCWLRALRRPVCLNTLGNLVQLGRSGHTRL